MHFSDVLLCIPLACMWQMAAATKGLPMRDIGGITVVDTPIVRAAQQYAREHSNEAVFGHIMRSWLYGVIAISADESRGIKADIDLEAHAVGALLHDLGWDQTPNSTVVSPNRRFEVDGAIAARKFIRSHAHGKNWDKFRVQRVWDAIALHTQPSIFEYKEAEVRVIPRGINMDFFGPDYGKVTELEYAKVGRVFPKTDFYSTMNDTLIWLCQSKPASTYDTFMQPWGDEYVQNYSAMGQRVFDTIFDNPYP